MPNPQNDQPSAYQMQKALAEMEGQRSRRRIPTLLSNWRFWSCISIPVLFFIAYAC